MCRQCFIAFCEREVRGCLIRHCCWLKMQLQKFPLSPLWQYRPAIKRTTFIHLILYQWNKFPCHHIGAVFVKQAAGMSSEQSYSRSTEGSALEKETESLPAPQVLLSACTPLKRQSPQEPLHPLQTGKSILYEDVVRHKLWPDSTKENGDKTHSCKHMKQPQTNLSKKKKVWNVQKNTLLSLCGVQLTQTQFDICTGSSPVSIR